MSGQTAGMTHDDELADRVREVLLGEDGLTERRMFGGLGFMLDGHMVAAASSTVWAAAADRRFRPGNSREGDGVNRTRCAAASWTLARRRPGGRG